MQSMATMQSPLMQPAVPQAQPLVPGDKLVQSTPIRSATSVSNNDFPGEQQGVLDIEFTNKFYDQVQEEELKKLNALAKTANRNNQLTDSLARVQEMSLGSLFQRTIDTLVLIINDLSRGRPLWDIFLATDRILYVGLVLIAVAFCLWLIDVTN